jgi:hypothetical protein
MNTKTLTKIENAWKLYYKMRFDRACEQELQQPEQVGDEAWKKPYLERWHAVNKMELERIRREGI